MIDIEEAEDYFEIRLDSENWNDASDLEKLKAIGESIRRVNRLRFKDLDPITNKSIVLTTLDENNILVDENIKIAIYEIAIELLDGTNMEQEIENLNVETQSYATVKTGYNPQLTMDHMRAGIPSAFAWSYLLPYLKDPKNITLSRGS